MMADVYDMTLKKEVLIEVGADVFAQCYQYERQHGLVGNEGHPISAMLKTIAHTQHSILGIKTEEELDRVRGQFDFARAFLRELNGT